MDDRLSLNNDGWDDSSSCTNSASNIATADSQPAPVSSAAPYQILPSCSGSGAAAQVKLHGCMQCHLGCWFPATVPARQPCRHDML